LKPSHANWLEAFAFTIVSEMPECPERHHGCKDRAQCVRRRLIRRSLSRLRGCHARDIRGVLAGYRAALSV
jgi:hypothetical protein